MLAYQQMEELTYARQADYLAEAELERLERSLAPHQPHPLLAWLGQQLVVLGRQLQGEERTQELLPARPA